MTVLPATLDHLVLAGPVLADAVARFAELSGVRPTPGGSHPGRGTANHLVGLARADGSSPPQYLEIIGPDPEQGVPLDRIQTLDLHTVDRLRLQTWAARPDDLDARVAAARAAGVETGEVIGMSRRTAAGDLLDWRLTVRSPLPAEGTQPFLIDWQDSVHPTATGLPTVTLHEFVVLSPDPATTAAALDLLGAPTTVVRAPRYGLRAVLEGRRGRFELS